MRTGKHQRLSSNLPVILGIHIVQESASRQLCMVYKVCMLQCITHVLTMRLRAGVMGRRGIWLIDEHCTTVVPKFFSMCLKELGTRLT